MLHDPPSSASFDEELRVPPLDALPVGAPPCPKAPPRPCDVRALPAPRRWVTPARLRGFTSVLVSLIVHAVVLITLAMLVFSTPVRRVITLVASPTESQAPPLEVIQVLGTESSDPAIVAPELSPLDTVSPGLPALTMPSADVPPTPMRRRDLASQDTLQSLMVPTHAAVGGGLEGRDPQWRARLVAARGGTPASESAVEKGLAWIAAHQLEDGSWHFNHNDSACGGLCRNPGTVGTTTGATGLALLPFLGAGYTHKQGPYQETVRRGLYYLTSRMLVTPDGGDLQEGTMYAHGIATIALCEAYAMTGDPTLRPPAQAAVDFICHAQHSGGGWRYVPGQPGDTTVFGWQIMALKSARMARLEVPSVVIENAMRYLDGVQTQDGAAYGYLKADNEPTPTAIGLLARMYYGWKRDDVRLARGVGILEALGPSRTDVYFDYYATQVLHHYHGPGWESWNARLRDHLVATQDTRGHENGSWYFADKHGAFGGRLYTTAMCCMILEVYYRHMPLYDAPSVETGF